MSPKKKFSSDEAKFIGEVLGIQWDRFDVEQFRRGMDFELQHGKIRDLVNSGNNDPLITGKITLAHLNEFPDYYDRLGLSEEESENSLQGKP